MGDSVPHSCPHKTTKNRQVFSCGSFSVLPSIDARRLNGHYTVHPGDFYGIKAVSDNISYNWPKSWHLQLAIFWIATAWVGAALYLAPIAGKKRLRFMGASAGWVFLGAGVFGFIITTPVVNYYEHSTYLTMNHGHTALFGTYGMLAVGLMLFALHDIVKPDAWNNSLLKYSFVGMNGGLFLMAIFTLLPVGSIQTWGSYQNGLRHARSHEFYDLPLVQFIGEWRTISDIFIIAGAACLLVFVVKAMVNLKPVGIADETEIDIPNPEAPEYAS